MRAVANYKAIELTKTFFEIILKQPHLVCAVNLPERRVLATVEVVQREHSVLVFGYLNVEHPVFINERVFFARDVETHHDLPARVTGYLVARYLRRH